MQPMLLTNHFGLQSKVCGNLPNPKSSQTNLPTMVTGIKQNQIKTTKSEAVISILLNTNLGINVVLCLNTAHNNNKDRCPLEYCT